MSSGAYILCIFLDQDLSIQIGKLGEIEFNKGYYYYVGSAFNKNQSNPLENRVLRHTKSAEQKKMHWHIDYLLVSFYTSVYSVILIPSNDKEECQISELIKNKTESAIHRFGCSDCNCESHLYYSKKYIFEKRIKN